MKGKQRIIAVWCTLFAFVSTAIFYTVKTKSVYGESQDGLWCAVLQVEFLDAKQTWSGYVYYKGKDAPQSITVESTIDGREHNVPEIEPEWFDYNICLPLDILMFRTFPTHVYQFLALDMSKNPPDANLHIIWEEDGVQKNAEIHWE